jgi:hypothetical protein
MLIEIVEKKVPELESYNLYKSNTLMDEIIKEVEKYQDRVKSSNKPGTGH